MINSEKYVIWFSRIGLILILTGCSALIILNSGEVEIDGNLVPPVSIKPKLNSNNSVNLGTKNIETDTLIVDTLIVK